MPEEENHEREQSAPNADETPRQHETKERRRLVGGEETRKVAEDYEYKPPKNLRPDLPEDQPTEQASQQQTQQE